MNYVGHIKDNQQFQNKNKTPPNLKVVFGDVGDVESLKSVLKHYSKQVISKYKDLTNLLIFPYSLEHQPDDLKDLKLFDYLEIEKVEGNVIKKEAFLQTGNLMGFLSLPVENGGQVKLSIHSRFEQNENKQHNDYFLYHMLSKVFQINMFDFKLNGSDSSALDILPLLFPYFLKDALSQGLYKCYQNNDYNDDKIKGRIDLGRFIRLDVPFAGKIAYSTRKMTYDNYITQLIRHTIEFIKEGKFYKILDGCLEEKNLIIQLTPTYNRKSRSKIIAKNLKVLNHPYYIKYIILQKICLQILRQEQMSFGEKDKTVSGILFDGAWLWEEYLNKVFIENCINIKHPKNKQTKGAIYPFVDWCGKAPAYPDFYIPQKVVLDAKYKRLNAYISPSDIWQVISYMAVLSIKKGLFIYPYVENFKNKTENDIPDDYVMITKSHEIKGNLGTLEAFGIKIPQNKKDFFDFQKNMEDVENSFIENLCQLTINKI